MVYKFVDEHSKQLTKNDLDLLFRELNKELRKRLRKTSKDYTVDLYVVGGACIVAGLQSRESTTDIDAMWTIGSEMRDCINIVGDKLGLGHDWCNCGFKRTRSYTDAIIFNSKVYAKYDRLVVRMVNPDLLLAMKLMSFREHKLTDKTDCISIINKYKEHGVNVNTDFICSIVNKYFNVNDLSDDAKRFIGLR